MNGNVFLTSTIDDKLKSLDDHVHRALIGDEFAIPKLPTRDIPIWERNRHPAKKGLSYAEGQARLLHDMANIELQAMELALRTLCEYPKADPIFREQLAALTLSEGSHLKMCIEGLRNLGYTWGHWPIHMALWNAVDNSDSLIDRLFIVHRYLEGSGLDSGNSLLERLKGVAPTQTSEILNIISREELDHVQFGSRWYRHFCAQQKLDADHKFKDLLHNLLPRLPRRMEPINVNLRSRALFSDEEIKELVLLRESQLPTNANIP